MGEKLDGEPPVQRTRPSKETFGRKALFLHGGVPKKQRDRMVERFQSDAGPPVFILSLKAGGTGLNLTRASHVFHFGKGVVEARVQGSRSRPYDVVIEVKTLSKAQWRRLAGALGKETFFTAKLLAGEMPENIGDVFKTAGLSLFPEKSKDLKTDCSCPDWSNPCKHIAAVYYLLGEEFDATPSLSSSCAECPVRSWLS